MFPEMPAGDTRGTFMTRTLTRSEASGLGNLFPRLAGNVKQHPHRDLKA